MALQVWLPLTKDEKNQGLCGDTFTTSGVTFTDGGKLGSKYLSAGTITIPASICKNFFNKNHMSFAFWLYPIGTSSSGIIMGQNAMSAGDNRMYSIFQYSTPNNLHLSWQDETSSSTFLGGSWSNFFPADTWTHCCITYDGNKAIIYQNGVQYATANGVSNRAVFEYNYPISGSSLRKLQDVRIYDHCLSPMEVKELAKGLVLHYPLNRQGWGQENLITNSQVNGSWTYPSSSYSDKYSPTTAIIPSGSVYTLSFDAKSTVAGDRIVTHYYSPNTTTGVITSQGYTSSAADGYAPFTLTTDWQRYWVTYTQSSTTAVKHLICPRLTSGNGTGTVSVKNVKFEEGDKPTPWCPNSSDALATSMGLNGTTEYDMSGFCNNGTRSDALTYSSDTAKYSVSTVFDANTDTIYVSPFLSLGQTLDAMSVCIWFKTNTLNSTSPNPVSLGENAFFRFRLASATSIWYYIRVGTTQCSSTFSCKTLTDDEWHHAMVIFDKGYVYVYIDGSLIGTGNHTATATYMTCSSVGTTWHLAGYSANSENFIGSLSDLRIYATALSADDVLSLYQNSAYIDSSGNVYGAVHSEV